MNEFLKSLAEAVADKLWLAPVIAIVSGVLTSLMPCSLGYKNRDDYLHNRREIDIAFTYYIINRITL